MKLTIGLEIHLKLATDTKLFCGCTNSQDFDHDTPNSYVCPICTAQPGALPVINQESIEQSLRLGHALACQLNPLPRWDRKSYFYPDSPAGYQITQLYHPINTDGQMSFWDHTYSHLTTVGITQAHLENDTAKTIHVDGTAYVDYNRSGTPLVEVVTAPDFHSADEVTDFLKELQRIVKWNNIAYADLEKGQMRVDVNLSVSDTDKLGTRVEIKNMNSFAAIRRAIDYEYTRHITMLANGETIQLSTVGRDDANTKTYIMRSKEDSMDYRYFPEPDLPMLDVSETIEKVEKEKFTLTWQEISKMNDWGFNKEQINIIIGGSDDTRKYFYDTLEFEVNPLSVIKWLDGEINRNIQKKHILKGHELKTIPSPEHFAEFCSLDKTHKYSNNIMNLTLLDWLKTPENSRKSSLEILKEGGFDQELNLDLNSIITKIINENPKVLEDYMGGKPSAAGFFVGKVMLVTAGKAVPQEVIKAVNEYLESIK